MLHLIFVPVLLLLPACLGTTKDISRKLTLSDKSQVNGFTSCVKGLMQCGSSKDKVELEGTIDPELFTKDYKSINFMVREKGSPGQFEQLCSSLLSNCLKKSREDFYCTEDENNMLKVHYIIKATKILSESEFILRIDSEWKSSIASESVTLPKIYECSDIILTLNGEEVPLGQSLNSTTVLSEPKVEFCCYRTPSPCKVYVAKQGKIVSESYSCAEYSSNSEPLYTADYNYSICENHVGQIWAGTHNVEVDGFDVSAYVKAIVITILFVTVIVIILRCYLRKFDFTYSRGSQ